MEHEDHLVMMMAHAYTSLLLVEVEVFRRMVTHLDPSIWNITRYKLIRTLIRQKLKKEETYVSSLLDGVHCFFISYDLWMSNMTQEIFQQRHIKHVSMPESMLISGCPLKNKPMVRFLQFRLVM